MVPLRLAVHNATLTPEDRADVRRRVTRLERFYARITGCRVTVAVPQQRRRTDRKLYRVRLVLTVPLGTIAIDRQPGRTLRTALDDAFQAVRRRLQDHARQLPGARKVPDHSRPRTRAAEETLP